jgi:hypothetical protein
MINIDFSKNIKGTTNISISKVLTYLANPKDQEKMLENTYNKHYNNPESEYYHLSKEEIKQIWENKGAASRQYGSLLDDYIGVVLTGNNADKELYKLDNDLDNDERLKGLVSSFDNFYNILSRSGDMEFITREKAIYLDLGEGNVINGRFDALFYNKRTGKYVIIDWKSSKSIDVNNQWQKLLGPLKTFDDCNYNTYTIQGYFYKTALLNGYLPEGTSEDDVEFLIVQLPGFVIDGNNNFKIYKPAFKYDKDLMMKIFNFAISKHNLLNPKKDFLTRDEAAKMQEEGLPF